MGLGAFRIVTFTVVGTCVGLAACSLFVDTDGLSDGGGLLTDASPESDASELTDATPDAAPKDASADVDAAALGFCAAHPGHSLCFDFDESNDVPSSGSSKYDPAFLYVDSTESVSPPHSLLTKYPAGESQQNIGLAQTSAAGKFSVDFELRFDAPDVTKGQLLALDIDVPDSNGVTDHSFYIESYGGQLHMGESITGADGGTTYPSTPILDVTPGGWVHVQISVDGKSRTIETTVNGAALADTQAKATFPAGTLYVNLGGYADSLPAEASTSIDDFLFDP